MTSSIATPINDPHSSVPSYIAMNKQFTGDIGKVFTLPKDERQKRNKKRRMQEKSRRVNRKK